MFWGYCLFVLFFCFFVIFSYFLFLWLIAGGIGVVLLYYFLVLLLLLSSLLPLIAKNLILSISSLSPSLGPSYTTLLAISLLSPFEYSTFLLPSLLSMNYTFNTLLVHVVCSFGEWNNAVQRRPHYHNSTRVDRDSNPAPAN